MTSGSRAKAATPKHKAALKVLAKPNFESGIAVERQVSAHVRTLIQQKKLPAGSRLPPIRLLAKLWDTNYFTVQAALRRVVGEGLLVQSPKLGTFVAGSTRSFQRACLYHDHDLRFESQETFFSQLNIALYRLLAERGIQMTTYFDHRRRSEIHTPPPEVRDMVREHQIDAIIATGIQPENSEWLTKLGIPYAAHSLNHKHGGITLDFEQFAIGVLNAVTAAKKRRLGIILRQSIRTPAVRKDGAEFLAFVGHAASTAGIEVLIPKGTEKALRLHSLEEAGFQLCEELLAADHPPDALMIFPDIYARGVISSLLKHGIRVPEDMLVLSHRNVESAFFTPLPVTWFDVHIKEFAQELLKQIDAQIAGKNPEQAVVRFCPETRESTASVPMLGSNPSRTGGTKHKKEMTAKKRGRET